MYGRRYSESSDSSVIDSDCDSLAESGYGSFGSQGRVDPDKDKPVKAKGLYDSLTSDYSQIIRDVEAEYQAAKRQKARVKTGNAGSAGSGISADSGYSSGPQELVPSGEDLWS